MTLNIRPEAGKFCHVDFSADTVTKTTQRLFPLREAKTRLALLKGYAEDLDREPVPAAPITSTELVEKRRGLFAVQFTMDLVNGPSVESLEDNARLDAATKIIGYLCGMSQIKRWEEPGILRVPVDAWLGNWHMDGEEPKMVDPYPPLTRDWLGRIKVYRHLTIADAAEQDVGRLGTIVPKLVWGALPYIKEEKSLSLAERLLPQDGDPKLRAFLAQRTDILLRQFYSPF